ncbi:MAG: hypothetical protein IPI67_01010 [Myxococcales bacterium]|nr:hypothetical protein [Myxococcales bacterium]
MFIPGFTQQNPFFDLWTRAAKEQLERMEQLGEQLAKTQGQGVERAQQAIDESAKLMKESLAYGLSLSNEWRKLNSELSKKATETLRTSV